MSLKRSPVKRRRLNRVWEDARRKVEEEGKCRYCGLFSGIYPDIPVVDLHAAHVIGRAFQDELSIGPRGGKVLWVNPKSVIPLCTYCHDLQHAHKINLAEDLTFPELMNAARACKRNGLNLRRRLAGGSA